MKLTNPPPQILYLLSVEDTNLGAQLHELDARQWLGENVRELLVGAD